MNINRKAMVPTAAVLIAGAGIFGTTLVSAQSNTNQNPYSGLVQMIAQKFNLDQSQVQNVANQYASEQKQNRDQRMQQTLNNHLGKLVQQGKITSAQEQAIKDEITKIKGEISSQDFKNMTPSERKQKMQSIQDEVNTWAKSHGIDPQYVLFGASGDMGMRMGHGWKKPSPSASPSATPQAQ